MGDTASYYCLSCLIPIFYYLLCAPDHCPFPCTSQYLSLSAFATMW